MTAQRFVLPYETVIDASGVPLPGAQLFFYTSGTDNLLATYTDAALSTPNANPVVADGAGVFPNIFLQNLAYKVVLEDDNGDQVWTADPVQQNSILSINGVITPCTAVLSFGTITLTPVSGAPAVSEYALGTTAIFAAPAGTGPFLIQIGSLAADPLYDTPGVTKTASLAGNQLCMITYSPSLAGWVLVNTPPPAAAAITGVISGTMILWPAPTPPSGWLTRDGSEISRTTYASLNAIANAAGYAAPWGAGDGSSTFNLPNDLGYFERCWDSAGSVDPGRTFGSIQADGFASHAHNLLPNGHSTGGIFDAGTGGPVIWQTSGGAFAEAPIAAVQATGSASETRPKNRAYLPIIKT